jgi:CDGSH-type Zn-finger protein
MKTVSYELESFHKTYEMTTNTKNYKVPVEGFQKCRFCGEENPQEFNDKAHVIAEFTGNKDLIYFSECDNCNNTFSKYERDLSIFAGLYNTMSSLLYS